MWLTCQKNFCIVLLWGEDFKMKTFDWDERYNVKVERFNEQHKHLFEIVKKIYVAMENKDDKLALAMIINDLTGYSKEHFTEEEACLLEAGYPDYEKHKKEHKIFIDKIERFAADYNYGKHLLHFDILIFLKNWVLQHIMVADKAYGAFLNSKGIS